MKFLSLKYKLLFFSIIISVALTFILVSIEITEDNFQYEQDLKQNLENFELTYSEYISRMVWALDHGALVSFVNYEISKAKINYIEITDTRGGIIASAGDQLSSKSTIHKFDILYQPGETEVNIGTVVSGGKIPSYTESFQERWIDLLIVNGLLVAIIFTTSYLLFYRQVLARLTEIKQFTEKDSFEELEDTIFSNSTRGIPDEISLLANSIIDRNLRIKKEFKKRVEAEKELTEKNSALTLEVEERLITEQQLEKSQTEFQAIFSSITDAVIFVDPDRKVLMINPAFTELFGYTFDDVQGKTTEFLYEDKAAFHEQGEKRYNKNAEIDQPLYETQYIKKDGSSFTVEILGVPVRNTNEMLVGFLGIIRDVTERKKNEEERNSLENRLRQAQKMEAIGTLAGGIAHDFNNILSAILGYTEIAREDCLDDSTIAHDLDQVIDACERAKNLVHQILSFSRQADTESASFIPANLVLEALKMLRQTIPSTIELHHDIARDTNPVFADPTQINQILMNLCTNAYHALEKTGGKISVSLKEIILTEDELLHEFEIQAGSFIQISVTDSGPGIPPSIQDKIFEPFFTTKKVGKGTGMGLSIVHGIVKNIGGFISLDNENEIGTTFNVFLPVDKNATGPVKSITLETATLSGTERILFIDDEESLARMAKIMLERVGYQVTAKTNSIEALDFFKTQPDQFDLVITDQTMPGMTGTEISQEFLKIRPDIPIILCTGYSSLISKDKAEAIGIADFALKPFSRKNLTTQIRAVLDQQT